jgi:hypothetical protein
MEINLARQEGTPWILLFESATGTTDEVELGEFPELKIQGKWHELNRESTHPNTLSIRCYSLAWCAHDVMQSNADGHTMEREENF